MGTSVPKINIRSWWRHAFAVDPPGPAEPEADLVPVIDRVCREVVRRRLTTPVLISLEMGRPLNYVGSQALHFLRPILAIVLDTRELERFASFLEKRGSVEYLAQRLEHHEREHARAAEDPAPRANATPEEHKTE